jgi:transcriptional regulator with XRE-family HTH domain
MHPEAKVVGNDVFALVALAQRALGYSHQAMADAVGSSQRTVQRWSSETSHPTVDNLRKLAIVVYPHDAGIAKRLAALVGETAQSLGLTPAAGPRLAEKTPSAAPALPPKVTAALAESVVAAAAEAMDVSPRVARPALLAAMERASAVGIGVDDLLTALRPIQAAAHVRRS